jgi:hypothetical protein
MTAVPTLSKFPTDLLQQFQAIENAKTACLVQIEVGFMIGGGRLNCSDETILETCCSYHWAAVTLDYQFFADPAYNSDRGPVSVITARYRAQF